MGPPAHLDRPCASLRIGPYRAIATHNGMRATFQRENNGPDRITTRLITPCMNSQHPKKHIRKSVRFPPKERDLSVSIGLVIMSKYRGHVRHLLSRAESI